MSLRYQKRINIGNGVGINVGSGGVSTSLRTKYGSIGPRGFSLRTGIPGLSFRMGKGKKGGAEAVIILVIGGLILTGLVVWNLALFLAWAFREGLNSYRRYKLRKSTVPEMAAVDRGDDSIPEKAVPEKSDDSIEFIFKQESVPLPYRNSTITIRRTLMENRSFVNAGVDVLEVDVAGNRAMVPATSAGTIVYHKRGGEEIRFGECVFTIELAPAHITGS